MFKINKKKSFYISILFSLIAITFSCNNSTESKLAYTDVDTVKDMVIKKESEISWTKALESGRLTDPVPVDNRAALYHIPISPDLLKILDDYNDPVYPEISDFGSLDSSKLNAQLRENLDNFCNKLNEDIYDGVENYFNSSYIFNYVFFMNDFTSGWKTNFKEDFPLEEEKAKEIREAKAKNKKILEKQNAKKQSEQEDEGLDENKDKNNDEEEEQIVPVNEVFLFKNWVIGEPFEGEEIIQVPVRFYCKPGTVDITLYINKTKQNSIYQITIDRWGIN